MVPFLTAVLLFQVQDLRQVGNPCPFVLVTVSGERVGTLDRPNHDGKPVKFRLCSNRQLTMFSATDVDWASTEAANARDPSSAAASAASPAPTKPSLSGFAKQTKLRDADEAVKQNQTLSGKMKMGGREISLDESAPFFGKESVAAYVRLGTFVADTSGCPLSRARAYGTVKNVSRFKLRNLRALVVIGSLRSGSANGQVQTMDPSDLVPGEESEIFLWLSCDWAGKSTPYYQARNDAVIVALPDVAGRIEEVAKPDGTSPFEAPTPSKSSSTARTPAPAGQPRSASASPR